MVNLWIYIAKVSSFQNTRFLLTRCVGTNIEYLKTTQPFIGETVELWIFYLSTNYW